MKPYLLWLRARGVQHVVPWIAVLCLAGAVGAGTVFPMAWPWKPDDIRDIPLVEVFPALAATLLGPACRPRLWPAEQVSLRRIPMAGGLLSFGLAMLPIGTVALAGRGLPNAPSHVMIVMVIAAIALVSGALLAPHLAWAAPLLIYLTTVMVQTVWLDWSQTWWPLADPRQSVSPGLVMFVVAALAAGVAVQAATRGGTARSSRSMIQEG